MRKTQKSIVNQEVQKFMSGKYDWGRQNSFDEGRTILDCIESLTELKS